MHIPFPKALLAFFFTAISIAASAAPIYQPFGSNATYGSVTHQHRVLAANGNPAAGAAIIDREQTRSPESQIGGGIDWGVSAGLEYGDVQDIFDTIDELSKKYKPSDSGESGDNPGQNPNKPPGGIDIGEIIDELFPDFRPALEAAAEQIATQVVTLALIETEAYARANISSDFNFLLGRDMAGGTWTAHISLSGNGKSYGITDNLEFDYDAALQDLEDKFAAAGLSPGDNPRLFELIGNIAVSIDPNSGLIKMLVDNDSSILSKASKTTEISVGYSRLFHESERGKLFLGAELKLYQLSLSRTSVRFGDITNSEELFESLKDLHYKKDNDHGFDVGALWVGDGYQLGATILNINQPVFHYPNINLTPYSSETVIKRLHQDQVYVMERQYQLEGSIFSSSRRWALNIGIDANAITDPMGDNFQWATLSGSYSNNSFWLPNLRVGYRRNLAGSKLTYLSAGVTAFKYLNVDLSSTLDTVSISGDKLPRGLMLNVGFQADF